MASVNVVLQIAEGQVFLVINLSAHRACLNLILARIVVKLLGSNQVALNVHSQLVFVFDILQRLVRSKTLVFYLVSRLRICVWYHRILCFRAESVVIKPRKNWVVRNCALV